MMESPAAGRPDGAGFDESRRQLDHDIRHELATIMLLASLLSESDELGVNSRRRARQIIAEASWLDRLVRSYRDGAAVPNLIGDTSARRIRLDSLIANVLLTARLHVSTRLSFDALPTYVFVDRVAFGRALRNLIWNGLEAAGPSGQLAVRIAQNDHRVVVDIEDDGPGFDPQRLTGAPIGLEIVRQVITSCSGELHIGRGSLGGCRMRLILPVVPPAADVTARAACLRPLPG